MTHHTEDPATADAWAALEGHRELVQRVSFDTAGAGLPSRLPVRELARASVAVSSLAAAELLALRNRVPVPAVRVCEAAVATAFTSERHLRIDGRTPTSFAPLSGFWRAADGWVRTHANYPHHRARLLGALGIVDQGSDRTLADALAGELASRPARQVQERVYAAGGLAVAVAGEPTAAAPALVHRRRVDQGDARPLAPADLPAAGVRVLDLTRVIAGPVATRSLALLGADVLRVDAPWLPEDPDAHADTGLGKRSTLLDLGRAGERERFEDLLRTADVVVTGYRPGALDRHGLAPEELLARHPGLVLAELCAWGWSGPWAGRRGFDSLVQAGTGIAAVEASADGRPGVLPAQALDHGTGYLLAAAVLRALSDRQATGGGHHLRLSLAGTASWLLHDVRPAPPPDGSAQHGDQDGQENSREDAGSHGAHDPEPWLTETASPYGLLRHARSPLAGDGVPARWSSPPSRWGTDRPHWA